VFVSTTGIRWLSGYLKSREVIARLVFLPDQTEELYSPETLEEIASFCQDSQVVGISLTSNMVPQASQLSNKIKEAVPAAIVVWGASSDLQAGGIA